jgi:RIO-like serine/threonine protein kinase
MFTTSELIKKLPSSGKVGLVHGDFTLENILFYNNKFYFIDANPTDINAIEFDVNKIRQDLECLWFVRNESDIITYKIVCDKINFHLKNKWEFMNNNYILILMLLRILPYCTEDTTQNFLIKEINKLWQ